jgi:hypothetical protein
MVTEQIVDGLLSGVSAIDIAVELGVDLKTVQYTKDVLNAYEHLLEEDLNQWLKN